MTRAFPKPGDRFILRRDVDRFPDFIASRGMTGIVTLVQGDGLITARMDQDIPGADAWDNEIWWYEGFLEDTIPM